MTNHGVLQAKRLGSHLAKRRDAIGSIKKLFTSNLQRAYRTAEAIAEAQSSLDNSSSTSEVSEVVQLPELREKDFGSSEGKKFGARQRGPGGDTQFDAETRDSMKNRIDRFLDVHLAPVVDEHASMDACVVIVAHGIILAVLLKALLSRYPTKQMDSLYQHGEILAAWSNTGVLQAKIDMSGLVPEGSATEGADVPGASSTPRPAGDQVDLSMTVQFTNNVDHLQGLKKTKGGIGSAKFDAKQRTMDSFFGPKSKKRKLDEL